MKRHGATPGSALRPWQSYLVGQALVALGAALLEFTGSYVPLALTGAAALMLTVPLLREIRRRARQARAPRRRD